MIVNICNLKSLVSPWMLKHLKDHFSELSDYEFNTRLEEFLKFMYLSSKYNESFFPLTDEIDELWHEYIVQTLEYAQLCQALPSKRFLHHQSGSLEEYTQIIDPKALVRRYLEWLPTYYLHFGAFTVETSKYWYIIDFLKTELHLDLDYINKIAENEAYKFETTA